MDVNQLLNAVKNGTTSVEEAAAQLKYLPYEDLGFAKLDHHRSLRSGFPEVIFCQGKTKEQIVTIFEHFIQADAKVLATRASQDQYEAVHALSLIHILPFSLQLLVFCSMIKPLK